MSASGDMVTTAGLTIQDRSLDHVVPPTLLVGIWNPTKLHKPARVKIKVPTLYQSGTDLPIIIAPTDLFAEHFLGEAVCISILESSLIVNHRVGGAEWAHNFPEPTKAVRLNEVTHLSDHLIFIEGSRAAPVVDPGIPASLHRPQSLPFSPAG